MRWLFTFADFCTFSLFRTHFSIFVRLAGSVPVDLLRTESSRNDGGRVQDCVS